MNCAKVFLSTLLVAVHLMGVYTKLNFKAPIQFSCLYNAHDTELRSFTLTHDYVYDADGMDAITNAIGKKPKLSLFLLGFEIELKSISGSTFLYSREQSIKSDSSVCTVSYKYIESHSEIRKHLKYEETVKKRVPEVVEMMTKFLKVLVESKDHPLKIDGIFLSGFCLGGHIAGLLGRKIKKDTKGKQVPVVWAFDPPSPGFNDDRKSFRVRKGDAKFVVVFHTSTIGVAEVLGDVDVFVNNIHHQPGCKEVNCNHLSGISLKNIIMARDIKLRKNADGFPLAYKDGKCAADAKVCPLSPELFAMDFTTIPKGVSGVYYMNTGDAMKEDSSLLFRMIPFNFLEKMVMDKEWKQ